ncbi:MAG: hypothetical protein JWP87_1897 [Labilithrix sp.]|nr:hypothetical protein [Labilithrix sp.]
MRRASEIASRSYEDVMWRSRAAPTILRTVGRAATT